jgi:hypothetical protein
VGHSREASTAFSEACTAFLRIMLRIGSARRTLRCSRNGLSRCFAVMSQFESLLPTQSGSPIDGRCAPCPDLSSALCLREQFPVIAFPPRKFYHEREHTRKASQSGACGIRRNLLPHLPSRPNLAVGLGVARRRRQILLADDMRGLCGPGRIFDSRGSETLRKSEPDLVHNLGERRACRHHGGTVHL